MRITRFPEIPRAAGLLILLSLTCCAENQANEPACSVASIDLGSWQSPSMMFRLVNVDDVPVSAFWWRYRRQLLLASRWSKWEHVDDEDCLPWCGYGGITDQEESKYEIEICRPGHPTVRFSIDVRYSRPANVTVKVPV
jgi:hypothetical protein